MRRAVFLSFHPQTVRCRSQSPRTAACKITVSHPRMDKKASQTQRCICAISLCIMQTSSHITQDGYLHHFVQLPRRHPRLVATRRHSGSFSCPMLEVVYLAQHLEHNTTLFNEAQQCPCYFPTPPNFVSRGPAKRSRSSRL